MAASGPSSTVTSTTVPLIAGAWGPSASSRAAVRPASSSEPRPTSRTVAPRLAFSSVGRALGDDLPVVEHDQGVGQAVGLLEVLGGEQHGGPAADQLLDDLPQVVAALRVETGGRLVEEEDGRPGHQGGGQVEAPPHAARVGLERPVAGVGQVELGRAAPRPAPPTRGSAQVVEVPHHLEVLPAGQVLVDRGVLAGQSDEAPDQAGLFGHVVAEHPGPAAVGLQDGGQDAHRGGLARAVGPEQTEDGALVHGEAHPVEGPDLVLALEGLLEFFGFDRVLHAVDPVWSEGDGRACVAGGGLDHARPDRVRAVRRPAVRQSGGDRGRRLGSRSASYGDDGPGSPAPCPDRRRRRRTFAGHGSRPAMARTGRR